MVVDVETHRRDWIASAVGGSSNVNGGSDGSTICRSRDADRLAEPDRAERNDEGGRQESAC